jgi:hypothetical protein
MLGECPHCYRKVIPLSDNHCPACQKNVLAVDGVDRNLTSMTVRASLNLPSHCYSCDAPTTRFVSIKRSLVKRAENPIVRLVLAGFAWWTLLLTGPKRLRDVAVRLPQCPECARRGRPEPRHVDFERFEMSFVVNRRWRERLRSAKS